jgi:SPX domain protein involved in polyphosphate accumulation
MNPENLPEREEYKYYIPRSVYSHLMNDLGMFTKMDDNVKAKDGKYHVTSIYFDSIGLKSYFDKIEGQSKREKLRLRHYPSDIKGPLNVELKCKRGNKCIKKKVRVNRDEWQKILQGKYVGIDLFKGINHIHPFIRIDYKRKALFAKNDRKIRITVDYNVKCRRFIKGTSSKSYISALKPGAIILEIKTPNYFPFWLTAIIKKYSLNRSAISKYTLAVQSVATNSCLCVK